LPFQPHHSWHCFCSRANFGPEGTGFTEGIGGANSGGGFRVELDAACPPLAIAYNEHHDYKKKRKIATGTPAQKKFFLAHIS
jgi:hypothetical protein